MHRWKTKGFSRPDSVLHTGYAGGFPGYGSESSAQNKRDSFPALQRSAAGKGFPYMGIWSARDADFVCIEPWLGITDSVHSSGKLEEKEGILSIEPGETYTAAWTILTW